MEMWEVLEFKYFINQASKYGKEIKIREYCSYVMKCRLKSWSIALDDGM